MDRNQRPILGAESPGLATGHENERLAGWSAMSRGWSAVNSSSPGPNSRHPRVTPPKGSAC